LLKTWNRKSFEAYCLSLSLARRWIARTKYFVENMGISPSAVNLIVNLVVGRMKGNE
jgi:hypothetical protein